MKAMRGTILKQIRVKILVQGSESETEFESTTLDTGKCAFYLL
jgi:hypothetical protein